MRIVRIRSCIFVKTTPVWAEIATEPGMVKTKEGVTNYSDLAGITIAPILAGAFGIVIKLGNVPGALAGLGALPGAPVYLSDTAGGMSLTPPPGLTDALIRLGRAEPADAVASATANDLWLSTEILAGA